MLIVTKTTPLLLLCGLLLCGLQLAAPASAAIYSCTSAAGITGFQDRPCAQPKPAARKLRTTVKKPPAEMHASWFARPAQAVGNAYCTQRGCECESLTRSFSNGMPLAIADALYLDGGWHRYDTSVVALQTSKPGSADNYQLREVVTEAACAVMMSQLTLKSFTYKTLASMRQSVHDAEDRGYDDPEACDGSDPVVCDYVAAVQLYRRILADIKALRPARDLVETDALAKAP